MTNLHSLRQKLQLSLMILLVCLLLASPVYAHTDEEPVTDIEQVIAAGGMVLIIGSGIYVLRSNASQNASSEDMIDTP